MYGIEFQSKSSRDYGKTKPFKEFLQSRLKNGIKSSEEPIALAAETTKGIQSFSSDGISQWLETHDRVLVAIQKNLGKAADERCAHEEALTSRMNGLDSRFQQIEVHQQRLSETLEPRLDRLSSKVHESQEELSAYKQGIKRKFDDVDVLISDLEQDQDESIRSLKELEATVQELSLTIDSLTEMNAKRSKKELATSAAVGALTGVLVVAGMIFGPEWA